MYNGDSPYEQRNQQQHNNGTLPPLLLDALGGGKRPSKLLNNQSPNNLNNNQSIFAPHQMGMPPASNLNNSAGAGSSPASFSNHQRSRSQRSSRSRERSLTPGIFGSPSASNLNQNNDADAPPLMMLSDTTPATNNSASRPFKPPALHLNQIGTMGDHGDTGMSGNYQDDSPGSAMSVDARSSTKSLGGTPYSQSQQQYRSFGNTPNVALKNPSTPASLSSNGSTVTFIGFPPNKRNYVIEIAANRCGPIYHINKPEKTDANWLIITFLNAASAERALDLDGEPQEGTWVLCVKRGDSIGAISGGKAKPRMDSPRSNAYESPMIDSPLMQLKNQTQKKSLLFDDTSLYVPSPIQRSANDVRPSSLYPKLPEPSFASQNVFPPASATETPPMLFGQEKHVAPPVALGGMAGSSENVKPAGLLTKVADFLFGW